MGWLFDVLGISVDGFVSSIFNGIINWIYEVIFSVIKVVFTKINETGSDLFRLPWVQSLVNFFYILGWALFAIGLVVSIDDEENNAVRELLTKDLEHMESIQSELSNSRQFYLVYRFRNQSKDLVGTIVSRLEKCMSEYDFVCKRLEKSDLKQFLAVYFGISSYGAEIADVEGATNENM